MLRLNRAVLTRAKGDETGGVSVIFGGVAVVLVFSAGMAIDYARAFHARTVLQFAADEAARAAAVPLGMTDGQRVQRAIDSFAANTQSTGMTRGVIPCVTVNSTSSCAQTASSGSNGVVTVQGATGVNTYFVSVMGVTTIQVAAKASVTVSTLNSEISVMIPQSGSMGANDPTTGRPKIMALQQAGNNFVSTLFPSGADLHVRVAITPVSDFVNAGPYTATATGQPSTGTYTNLNNLCISQQGPFNGRYSGVSGGRNYSVFGSTPSQNKYTDGRCGRSQQWNFWGNDDGSDLCNATAPKAGTLISCVTERTGAHAYDDAAPTNSSASCGSFNQGDATGTVTNYSQYGKCWTGGVLLPEVTPLTDDPLALSDVLLNATSTGGGHAEHIGVAWSWYALSPNWNSVWPSSSAAAAYSDSSTKKHVVIITDGEPSQQYSSTESATQAITLCSAMKAQGITVHTIGYGLSPSASPGDGSADGAAMQFLSSCASSAATTHFAPDANSLNNAMQTCANHIKQAANKITVTP